MSSIVVSLHHGACMFFAGSFDAAYVMTISALPSQVLPTTNKRNAALVQKHMEEAIGVQPKRGLLRFVATQEENMANNGKTMAGEIDELERSGCITPTPEASSAGEGGTNDARKSKTRRKLSVKVSFFSYSSRRWCVSISADVDETVTYKLSPALWD
jgi:hypothetical protein